MATISKQAAKDRLGNVPEEKRFWCNDGRYLANLEELKTALEGMTDETYAFHKNEAKSDFSKWVGEVVGDDKLAADLNKSGTSAQAARAVAERVRFLKGKAGV